MYGRILSLFPADDKLDWKEPIWRGVSAGGAAIIATLLTYPLDLVRAKLAVHDVSVSGASPGVIGTFKSIYKSGGLGFQGLYRGIRPSLFAVAPFIAV
jgi:hypothetical protein